MKRCVVYQRKVAAVCEDEMRMESVVCPKPRRLGVLNPSVSELSSRPLRCHQTDTGDSRSGSELLDMILTKGSYGPERSINQVFSSPYFCGSPPSRASNPVSQDALFGNEKLTALSVAPPSPSSSSAACKGGGGCIRMKFGHAPATVRIEGFDCLSRDRSNCSIYAVA